MIESTKINQYFFNMKMFVNIIFFFFLINSFHIDMTDIVDSLFELYHSHSWKSFMRTCFNDFIQYRDETSIYSSDFLKYTCTVKKQILRDLEQIIFFDRDRNRKTHSFIESEKLLRIKKMKLKFVLHLLSIVNINAFCSSSTEIESQELLIIENNDQFIKMN